MKKFMSISLLLFSAICGSLFAMDVDVRIYSSSKIKSANIKVVSGKYVIYNYEKKVSDFYKNTVINISVKDGQISLINQGQDMGLFDKLYVAAEGHFNKFSVFPNDSALNKHVYDDGIKLSVNDGDLIIINKVELERYIAGVTESACGACNNFEFMKVQSVISRTYTIGNLKKHLKTDGYNLCDNSHCQLFNGACSNDDTETASMQTSGDIITDPAKNIIYAAYHINCGGQTANSEDLWNVSTSYLISVNDTFCSKMPHAIWEKNIFKKEWLNYLHEEFSFPVMDLTMVNAVINFNQNNRKINLIGDADISLAADASIIPLKAIMNDWKLNSVFFNISNSGDTLFFTGKGYGHGAGLCQEGAMRMAELNRDYKEIIKFYYKGVSIINMIEMTAAN